MESRPKRRSNPEDRSFKPGQKRSRKSINDENSMASMFAMRASNETTQLNEKGDMEPIKNTFLAKQSLVPPHCSLKAVSAATTALASQAPTYRPVGTIVWENGSPVKVITPHGKTPLPRVSNTNAVSLFSNSRSAIALKEMRANPKEVADLAAFKASDSYKNLVKLLTNFKEQAVRITQKLLSTSLKERRDKGYQRSSQADAVTEPGKDKTSSSAKEHVKAAQLVYTDTIKWEWLHLVAYMIWAERSQNNLNLVAGSFGCNTEMLMIESLIPYLAKKYPEGFDLKIHADLIEPSNIAYNISYTIEAGKLKLPLNFNPLSQNNPHRDFGTFFSAAIKALVEEERKTNTGPDASNLPLEGHFYQPPKP